MLPRCVGHKSTSGPTDRRRWWDAVDAVDLWAGRRRALVTVTSSAERPQRASLTTAPCAATVSPEVTSLRPSRRRRRELVCEASVAELWATGRPRRTCTLPAAAAAAAVTATDTSRQNRATVLCCACARKVHRAVVGSDDDDDDVIVILTEHVRLLQIW